VTQARPAPSPRPPPWWRTLRADPPFVMRIGIGVGFLALIILVWFAVTYGDRPEERLISPSKLPSPWAVFGEHERTVYDDAGEPTRHARGTLAAVQEAGLRDGILASLRRVIVGIGWAIVFGVGLGVLAGSFRAIAAALSPVVIFLRSVPMGALLPLTLMLFSTGEKQKEMFIFLAVSPFVFSDTVRAISTVPQRYVETALTLGASRFQVIRKVLFPLALPDIVSSLRFQFGLAFGYIMLAEAINPERGLGAMLNVNEKRGLIEQNYLLLFIIAAIAFAIDWGVRTFQRGVFPYRKDL
jgi:ABC-type nitrate/sulfonate/bicarbonate transport system permease component